MVSPLPVGPLAAQQVTEVGVRVIEESAPVADEVQLVPPRCPDTRVTQFEDARSGNRGHDRRVGGNYRLRSQLAGGITVAGCGVLLVAAVIDRRRMAPRSGSRPAEADFRSHSAPVRHAESQD